VSWQSPLFYKVYKFSALSLVEIKKHAHHSF